MKPNPSAAADLGATEVRYCIECNQLVENDHGLKRTSHQVMNAYLAPKTTFDKALEAQQTDALSGLRTQIEKAVEESSLLQMPMIDLDKTALEYGRTAGLREALRIIDSAEARKKK